MLHPEHIDYLQNRSANILPVVFGPQSRFALFDLSPKFIDFTRLNKSDGRKSLLHKILSFLGSTKEQGAATFIDGLTLMVGNIIIFEQIFTQVIIMTFDFGLSTFNGPTDNRVLNRLIFRNTEPAHHVLDPIWSKNPH